MRSRWNKIDVVDSTVFIIIFILEIFVLISSAYAQATAAAPETSLMSFLPIILMFVVLYFVMMRPQMKRQKEQKAMLDALAKNNEVVTAGGIIGKISKVTDNFVTIEVSDGVEIQVQKSAVTALLPPGTIKSI